MKAHLKRIAVPNTWILERKENVFITRPYPGGIGLDYTMPLSVVMRSMAKCAKTLREVKYILHHKTVLVDGKRRTEDKFPVSLFSTVSLKESNEHYRMSLDKRGRLAFISIEKDEAAIKPCRIINKTKIRGKKTQINFSDGRNTLVDKDTYHVGDTVLLNLPDQTVKSHYPLQEHASVLLVRGKHRGMICTVKKLHGHEITVQGGDDTFVTSKQYAFVVGDAKPALALR
ncbi:30S ribosomal protein S4e [Candidatus Woesearchaeota archaeon]|nr:30S ribosomal protein S4e [Candidatus Woesearchaeota archaeon]